MLQHEASSRRRRYRPPNEVEIHIHNACSSKSERIDAEDVPAYIKGSRPTVIGPDNGGQENIFVGQGWGRSVECVITRLKKLSDPYFVVPEASLRAMLRLRYASQLSRPHMCLTLPDVIMLTSNMSAFPSP